MQNLIATISVSLFFLLACNSPTADTIVQVRVNKALVNVEIADTDKERALGLMFRDSIATNAGMLFVFQKPHIPSFYMKNTSIPLDILFIDGKGKIVTIRQMHPFQDHVYHSPSSPVLYALEVNQGWAARHGVTEGMTVEFLSKSK
jgi:uncharacterized membrane protein (UPF0127 family)